MRCFVEAVIPSAKNKRDPDNLARQSNPINIIATLLMTYGSSTLGGLSSDHNSAREYSPMYVLVRGSMYRSTEDGKERWWRVRGG